MVSVSSDVSKEIDLWRRFCMETFAFVIIVNANLTCWDYERMFVEMFNFDDFEKLKSIV